MRILAIDFGTKRIGLAITDNTQTIATPLMVVAAQKSLELTAKTILREINAYLCEIAKIIVGVPYLPDGEKSAMTELVLKFVQKLKEETTIPVDIFDERYTSFAAESLLQQTQLTTAKKKKKIDALAAAIILQDYLERLC